MDDVNKSYDGNNYTLNAIYSYSTDGTTWNGPYTGALPNNISVNNGGTVYFGVSPAFTGETGTYQLELTGSRTSGSGIDKTQAQDGKIKIYPNPANDKAIIDLSNYEGIISQISITNTQGQELFAIKNPPAEKLIPVDLQNIPQGLYFIQITTSNGIINQKITVQK